MAQARQYCTFYLDGLFFGVDVLSVQQVIRYQQATKVPLSQKVVTGLINLRGQIVMTLDMRRQLELREREPEEEPVNVVVRTETGDVSLLVDSIGDVMEVEEDAFEEKPETLKGRASDIIKGAYKLQDRLLLILDPEKAVRMTAGP